MVLITGQRMDVKEFLKLLLECFQSVSPPIFVKVLLEKCKAVFQPKDVSKSDSNSIYKNPSKFEDSKNNVVCSSEINSKSKEIKTEDRFSERLSTAAVVVESIISDAKEIRMLSLAGRLRFLVYSWLLRNEISKGGFIDLFVSSFFGQAKSRFLWDTIREHNLPVCPVPALVLQSCIHNIEAVTIMLSLKQFRSPVISNNVAVFVSSLLGLQLALKKHRENIGKYNQKKFAHAFPNKINRVTGGKEHLTQCEGGAAVVQTPWVNGDIQAITFAIDEGFARLVNSYGDVIPFFSYPTQYLDELKKRLSN
jgi:hypothetical protein